MNRALPLVCFFLFSATLFAQQSQTPPATPPPGGAAAEKAAPDAVSQVPLLRVYRQRRFTGSSLAPSIFVDGRQIARVGNGRRFTAKLTPGAHTIRSDDKSSAITLDVKSGQEYYIRVDEETGFWKGHGKLTLLLPEQGKPEYKLQEPIEPDRRFAKDLLVDEDATPAPPASEPNETK
jgi:hypothetical protein